MEYDPFNSRKFLTTHLLFIITGIIPIGYKFLGISDTVTLSVLGVFAAGKVSYDVANVKAKAYDKS